VTEYIDAVKISSTSLILKYALFWSGSCIFLREKQSTSSQDSTALVEKRDIVNYFPIGDTKETKTFRRVIFTNEEIEKMRTVGLDKGKLAELSHLTCLTNLLLFYIISSTTPRFDTIGLPPKRWAALETPYQTFIFYLSRRRCKFSISAW
jgi:hypothetical protein